MKKLLLSLALAVFAFAPAAFAEDVTYVAEMTGVTWGGCKKSVSSAFKKLTGSDNIKIENGEKKGTQKVTLIVADAKKDYTKKEAIKSLGDQAARFIVQKWTKAEG